MRAVGCLSETVSVALRVLVIDDNPRFLEAARSSLERQGVRVVVTGPRFLVHLL